MNRIPINFNGMTGKTNNLINLGKLRNTIGSRTRVHKYYSKIYVDPLNYSIRNMNLFNTLRDVILSNPPIILSAVSGDSQATIYFISGSTNGLPIIKYLYSIDGTNYTDLNTILSPITITGLTNGITYNITLKAANINGNSISSNSVTVTPNLLTPIEDRPLAPVITSTVSKTLDTITLSFTQETNDITITNYKYSIDNGMTYSSFSPIDKVSPVTITGLTSATTYNIKLRSTSSVGDSNDSNLWIESTYTQLNCNIYTDVGSSTWDAPEGVTEIEYLIVGGGGGGGGTYSKINVLGNVLVTDTPQSGAYWINSANLTNGRYSGRMYYGTNTGQNSSSFSDPIQLTASTNFTPNGVIYPYQKWYNFEMVYILAGALPSSTNVTYITPQGVPSSTYSNNVSAGSGGGGGGSIKTSASYPSTKYSVIPGTTYNLYVGAGGTGGTSGTDTENNGNSGENSWFDTSSSLVASGGSGGSRSRSNFNTNGGGGFSSGNLMGGRGGAGSSINGRSITNSEVYQWNSTVLRGTYGGTGLNLNFDGSGNKIYGAGGDGGSPNIETTDVTPNNLGKGGKGTGATVNSHSNGMDGGSGIIIIKYYT